MRWMWLALLGACSGGKEDTGTGTDTDSTVTDTDDNPTGDCLDAPSDAPTADAISAGGASVVCYYGPPEGYCRDLQSAASAQLVEGGDKAAIGCADALVITDGACPTDKLVGRCQWTAEEVRYYYECNQYDALFAGGPQESCESVGGVWEPM